MLKRLLVASSTWMVLFLRAVSSRWRRPVGGGVGHPLQEDTLGSKLSVRVVVDRQAIRPTPGAVLRGVLLKETGVGAGHTLLTTAGVANHTPYTTVVEGHTRGLPLHTADHQ